MIANFFFLVIFFFLFVGLVSSFSIPSSAPTLSYASRRKLFSLESSESTESKGFIPKTSTVQKFSEKKIKPKAKMTDKEKIEEITHDDIVEFIEKMPEEAREFFQKHFLPANPPPPPLFRSTLIVEEEAKRLWKEADPLVSIGSDGLFDSHINFIEEYSKAIVKSFDQTAYEDPSFTSENRSDLFSLAKKKKAKTDPKNGLIMIKLTSLKLLPLEISSNIMKNDYLNEHFIVLEVRPRGILLARKSSFKKRIHFQDEVLPKQADDEKEDGGFLNVLSSSDLLLSLRIPPKMRAPVPPSQYGRALSKKRGRGISRG